MNAQKFLEAERKNQKQSHAYLLIGSKAAAEVVLEDIIKTYGILKIDISTVIPEEVKGPKPQNGFRAGKGGEIKVLQTRNLLREISHSPQGKKRLAVIYDAEKLNASSGNVLLKSLEEPAGPVIFVLAANSPSVLPTIKSRCRIINLNSTDWDEEIETEEYIPILKKGFPEASGLIEKVVKEEKAGEIIEELTRNQRRKMLLLKKAIYAKNIEEIESANKKINQNGNQRLILECLILKIGDKL